MKKKNKESREQRINRKIPLSKDQTRGLVLPNIDLIPTMPPVKPPRKEKIIKGE